MNKRVTFITPLVPGSTGNGLSMRAGVWLECLAQDFDVDVVVIPIYPADPSAPDFVRRLAGTVSVFECSRGQVSGTVVLNEADQGRIEQLVQHSSLVVFFRLAISEIVRSPTFPSTPRILDLDDADWVREERLGKQLLSQELSTLTSVVSSSCDVVTFAEPPETISDVHDVVNSHIVHVPNISRGPSSPVSPARQPSTDLIFVGSLGYAPNEQGILWFISEVMPLLTEARLTIVGTFPSQQLRALESEKIRIAAHVPEVDSWYESASVAIVPLFAGSGTRTKILEAWAHELPVVSTTLGIEGIEDTRGALIADTASEFARACHRLLVDKVLAKNIAAAGYETWSHRYSLSHARHHISLAVEKALELGNTR
ncbi:glycosyltransferase family 4 protein [Aurantimicrobium minutum]|uniref:glycosyltransferase family 4 protein n=1 Tax=Aurantimicrobium minutum TaxID=708131 RepID=UPI0024752261|nr:glycosyltransferase [Aurantimicrobium minutum]MDH6423395.1 glycosyltransferase involved in cell wall biosynthesis [Aurantimicrobium minutum]